MAPFFRPLSSALILSAQTHLDTFALYGALEYSLATAKELLSLAHQASRLSMAKAHYIETLGGTVGRIEAELEEQRTMRLVLAASLKDTDSSLHILGADLLRQVVQSLQQPEILRWEDVMRGYMPARADE